MKPTGLIIAILLFGYAKPWNGADAATFPLPRSEPEAQGVSSAGVLAFVEAADRMEAMNSFMLVRHGYVVAEGWWAPHEMGTKRELYSLSKSFIATAVGMAMKLLLSEYNSRL